MAPLMACLMRPPKALLGGVRVRFRVRVRVTVGV
jgi:hypothetical protein